MRYPRGDDVEQVGRHQQRVAHLARIVGATQVDFLHVAVAADTEEDADRAARIETLPAIAGILERLVGDFEHQALLRVHDDGFFGRNAEEVGGKAVDIRQRAHRIVAARALPAGRRHGTDDAAPLAQRAPELVERGAAREAPGHADDGDLRVLVAGRSARRHDFLRRMTRQIGDHVADRAAFDQHRIAKHAAEAFLDAGEHLDGLDRCAAELGERHVDADGVFGTAQDIRPDAANDVLDVGDGRRLRLLRRGFLGAGGQAARVVGLELGAFVVMHATRPFVRQLIALQLAAGRARQARQGQNAINRIGQVLLGRLADFMRPRPEIGLAADAVAATPRSDEDDDAIAPRHRIQRGADGDAAVLEIEFLGKRALDVGGHDVAAVDENDVLQATGDGQAAVLEKAEIAGLEPAVGREQAVVDIAHALVARGDVGAANLHLADKTFRQDVALLADDAQLHRRQREADIDILDQMRILGRRHGLAVGGELVAVETMNERFGFDRAERHRDAGFRHAIHREHRRTPEARRTKQIGEAPHHRRRDRLGAVAEQAHAGQIDVDKIVRRHAIQHMLQTEVGRTDHRRAMPGDLPQPEHRLGDEFGGIELDLPHAAIQRHEMEGDQAHVVVIRHPAQRRFAGQGLHGIGDFLDVAEQVAVRQAHALGQAGGPRGKLQIDEIVLLRVELPRGARVAGLRIVDQPAAAVGDRSRHAIGVGLFLIGIDQHQRPAEDAGHAIELARRVRVADPRRHLGQQHGHHATQHTGPEQLDLPLRRLALHHHALTRLDAVGLEDGESTPRPQQELRVTVGHIVAIPLREDDLAIRRFRGGIDEDIDQGHKRDQKLNGGARCNAVTGIADSRTSARTFAARRALADVAEVAEEAEVADRYSRTDAPASCANKTDRFNGWPSRICVAWRRWAIRQKSRRGAGADWPDACRSSAR